MGFDRFERLRDPLEVLPLQVILMNVDEHMHKPLSLSRDFAFPAVSKPLHT
jgi:hypothetical protein